jgi:hypothetical protein
VRLALALCLLGVAACARGGDGSPSTPRVDAGAAASDASSAVPTSYSLDAMFPPDAATGDAGPPDAGAPDARAPLDACARRAEACDGRDDDCDGAIDEGARCPCERVAIAGGSYLFCASERSWIGAQVTCASVGYRLVVVEDAAEDRALHSAMAARGFDDTWIGITDAVTEMRWVDESGTPLAYTHWDDGEPNDGGTSGEDCGVIMTRAGRAAEWDDRGCETERPSVCEAP